MTEETKGTVTGRHGKKSPAWLYTAPGMFPYVEVEVLNGRVRASTDLQDTFEPLTPDLSAYRVEVRRGNDDFQIVGPDKEVLLTTQSVSIETLVRIATEHQEPTMPDKPDNLLPDPESLSNEQMDQAIRWAQYAQSAADEGNYRMMRAAGSAHPCPIEGCPMSVEEHHRLMFGVMAENEAMRREIQILNHQKSEGV